MAFRGEREFFIDEIAGLWRQQLNTTREAKLRGWTREQSALDYDTRLARITRLVRELAKLDEDQSEP